MRLVVLAAVAAAAGCASGDRPDPVLLAPAAPPPAVAASAIPERLGPIVDHHQHLLSPEAAAHEQGEGLKPAAVPADVARLLERRAAAWNDAQALAEVYVEGAILVEDSAISGRTEVADYVSDRFGSPYAITPLAYAEHKGSRQIAAAYTRGEGRAPMSG